MARPTHKSLICPTAQVSFLLFSRRDRPPLAALALMVPGIAAASGVRQRRIAATEIACQTKRSGVNPRTPRPVNSGTRGRGSDNDRRRRAPSASAPGEAFLMACARDRSRKAETQRVSVYESSVRRQPRAHKQNLLRRKLRGSGSPPEPLFLRHRF